MNQFCTEPSYLYTAYHIHHHEIKFFDWENHVRTNETNYFM